MRKVSIRTAHTAFLWAAVFVLAWTALLVVFTLLFSQKSFFVTG